MGYLRKITGILIFNVALFVTCYGQCVGPYMSYITSDQKDDYICGSNLNLTVIIDLPVGASGVTYNCAWVASNGGTIVSTSGNTAIISSSGTYEVTGSVISSSCSGSISINLAKITIRDGNISTGTYTPKHYWTFEPQSSYPINGINYPNGQDCSGSVNILTDYKIDIMTINSCSTANNYNLKHNLEYFNGYRTPYTTDFGLVGYTADINHMLTTKFEIPNTKQISQEFLIKFDPRYYSSALFSNNATNAKNNFGFPILGMEMGEITFGISFLRSGTTPEKRYTKIKLNGIDRSSWDYYMDNEWHHIVITSDLTTGRVRLFVDGVSPDGFSFNYFPNPILDRVDLKSGNNYWHTIGINGYYGRNSFGKLDEYAFYDKELTASLVAKHYDRAKNYQEHYSYTDNVSYCGSIASQNPPQSGSFISEYYPLGYTASAGTSGAGISAIPLIQYKNSPTPRYLPNNTLLRNFPWLAIEYLGGSNSNNYNSTNQAAVYAECSLLNAELALHWNYFSQIERNNTQWSGIKAFANKHPEIPTCDRTLWGQPSALVESLSLNEDYYLKDLTGKKYIYKGLPQFNPVGPKELVKIDGYNKAKFLSNHMKGLQRPLNFINEDGEVRPNGNGLVESAHYNGFNSDLVTSFNSYGGSWLYYQGKMKTVLRETYRDALFEKLPSLDAHKSKFSYYSVDGIGGHSVYQSFSWPEIKKIQKNFSGSNNYSTPDIYPAYPWQWFNSFGADHGMDWLGLTRGVEIADGDDLFSPFVCAGWNPDPQLNLTPGAWLGLLKSMGVLGAEFYYGSFFSNIPGYHTERNGVVINQDARTWAWQLLTPAYAQAITSRYEVILREGTLLYDPYLVDISSVNDIPFVNIVGGGANVYTTARKWTNPSNPTDIQYVISTSNQPLSNEQPPIDKKITLNHPDLPHELMLETRRQGSTYIYQLPDNTTRQDEVLIQLDGWHEPWHPTRWDEDYVFEAEVPDEIIQVSPNMNHQDYMNLSTITYDQGGGVVSPGDLQEYESFETFFWFQSFGVPMTPSNWGDGVSSPKLSYKFRVQGNPDYRLYVRARLSPSTGQLTPTTGINVNLMNEDRSIQIASDYIGCIDDQNWKWYSFGLCNEVDFNQLQEGYYFLDLIPENEWVVIDKIVLDKGKNRPVADFLPVAPMAGSCGSAFPNPDPYVPTLDFTWDKVCQGEVKLSSRVWPKLDASCNQNICYQWLVVDQSGVMPSQQTVACSTGSISQHPYYSGSYENPIFNFPASGMYDVTLTVFINGVSNTVSKTITVFDNPSVNVWASKAGNPIPVCKGEKLTLYSSVTGGAGNNLYSWYPSLTTLNSDQASTDAIPDDVNGTVNIPANGTNPFVQNQYKLTVTDANGCIGTGEVDPIVINAPLCVNITDGAGLQISNICYGLTSQSLKAEVCTTSNCSTGCNSTPTPSGNLSYKWGVSSQLSSCFPQSCTTQSVTISNTEGIESARYHVTVTDAVGCVGEANVDVIVNPSNIVVDVGGIAPNVFSETKSYCVGAKGIVNLGGVTATPSGSYNFTWKAEGVGTNSSIITTLNSLSGSSVSAGSINTELVPTLYTVTAEDPNSHCTGKGYVWLDVTDHVNASISTTPLITEVCTTGVANFDPINLYSSTTGGTSPFIYDWNPKTYLSNVTSATAIATLPVPITNFTHTHTVKVTDLNGCYSVAEYKINAINGTCKKGGITSKSEESTSIEKEVTEKGTIILFPNPNNGKFQLKFTGELEDEVLNVLVLDLQGKVITQKIKTKNELLIFELKELPRGVYFIRLFNDKYNVRVSTVID